MKLYPQNFNTKSASFNLHNAICLNLIDKYEVIYLLQRVITHSDYVTAYKNDYLEHKEPVFQRILDRIHPNSKNIYSQSLRSNNLPTLLFLQRHFLDLKH